ncbi:hypothetical protein K1T71_007775 [Dendrolimus kikuchii]|uniref:Uncharacterized protein n=1 Tax=Dendrolimus kikuchii TaxID=765133 RepID=A0ACC1CY11_9NEOP|nr:hypothetical protein K1T71_007775 [Dendrolimus kikuchii]
MLDDTIFYSSLLICMSLGSYYKKIQDPEIKRNYGAGLGILVACLICGHHIYHSVLMVWGNIIIIKCCDKRYLHQMSLAFTWIYLFYIHLNLTGTYIIWIHQMLALRLVGLAFEMRALEKPKFEPKAASTSTVVAADNTMMEPTAVDIISYAYYFIGLHKGPYYRWKTFDDHFKVPFGVLGDCRVITEQKLKKALICAVGYILLYMKYSPEVLIFYPQVNEISISDFDNPYDKLKFLIIYEMITYIFHDTNIKINIYHNKLVYPTPNQIPAILKDNHDSPIGGHIGSNRIADTRDVALEQEYNFTMLKCFENDKLLLGPRMKNTVKSWDMPTRYWFGTYIYKNMLLSNKEVRSAFSFFMYTMWLGPSFSQVIVTSTLWVYLHLEAEYSELYKSHGSLKAPWDVGYSLMRIFCLIYLTPCFVIQDAATILKYYNSIFWIYHIVMFFLILLAIVIYKNRGQT